MSILTPRQKAELHKAIVQYLQPLLEEHPDTLSTLTQVLQTSKTNETAIPQYLEKKWTTVLRLQKKIIDLENEANSYKALLDAKNSTNSTSSTAGGHSATKRVEWLPSAPSKTFATASTQYVTGVAIHPRLPWILGACSDGGVSVWNLSEADSGVPVRTWNAHTRAINGVRWSPVPVALAKGEKAEYALATCSSDLSIKVWHGDGFRHVRTLTGHEHTVSALAFSPACPTTLYLVSRDKAVKVWDLVSGHCVRTFVGHSDWVRDIDVAAMDARLAGLEDSDFRDLDQDEYVLTCSSDHSVRLLHHSGAGLALLLGHKHVVEAVKFLPLRSNRYIDAYLLENMARFPYLLEPIVENTLYTESLGFKYAVSAGRDNMIKLWLLPPPVLRPNRPPQPAVQNNAQAWHLADLVGHRSWVRTLDVHPGGRFVFSGADDKTVRVWDLAELEKTGKVSCVRTLEAHEGFVNAVHFARYEQTAKKSGDEERDVEESMRCLFASGGSDNAVFLWG